MRSGISVVEEEEEGVRAEILTLINFIYLIFLLEYIFWLPCPPLGNINNVTLSLKINSASRISCH